METVPAAVPPSLVPVKTEPRDPQTQPMPSYPTPSVPVPSPSHVPPPPSQTHAVAPMEDSMAHYEEQYDDYGQYVDEQHYPAAADTSHTLQNFETGKGETHLINHSTVSYYFTRYTGHE